ncbi:RISC-loading complex subunit TARBP2-like [Drosophila mauritiana]|uniref:RISC-loading complex subunit TARBP2-like n=1 Tax=Drosophila mauritiana TaxID=7226 RepID=A0A6P8L927_DROMA|nr:RISC-loading complex subunit TARBP2-like [Drosophila mauritiana]
MDANAMAIRTPVSILQKLLSRRGITPGYELQIEGDQHEPTFRFRVSFRVNDTPFTAMGEGRSKKEAKHAAARAVIDKLSCTQIPESPSSSAGPSVTGGGDGNATGGGDAGEETVGNPIGRLQELCVQLRWPPPSYETEAEVGLPHERVFTIACSVLDHRVMGKGATKKIAKRLAAHSMCVRLARPFTAMGAGRSKESAKNAADRAVIDKLSCTQIPESPSSSAGPSVTGGGDGNATGGGDAGEETVGNPIGRLQELCVQLRWPPPSYETEAEVGLPHERVFRIACSIRNYREMGTGKSKKIAKRLAAHHMWVRLQETPID